MLYLFIFVVLVIIIIWFILTSNKLNRCIVKINEADSGVDVALTKRYNVLKKMMDVVKNYTSYEQETMFEVINLRNHMTLEEKSIENNKMNRNFDKFNVLAEAYPELKSSDNYKALQQSIMDVEEHLQAARRAYNSNVSQFNQMIVTFPISLVSSIKGLKAKEFFDIDDSQMQKINAMDEKIN